MSPEPVRDAETVAVWQYHCLMCGAWWEDGKDPDDAPSNTTCTCTDGGMWEADRIGPWPAPGEAVRIDEAAQKEATPDA